MVLQWKLEIDKWCGRTFDWSTPEIAAGYYGCTVEDQIHRFRSASIEFVRHLCTVLIFVSLSLSLSLFLRVMLNSFQFRIQDAEMSPAIILSHEVNSTARAQQFILHCTVGV